MSLGFKEKKGLLSVELLLAFFFFIFLSQSFSPFISYTETNAREFFLKVQSQQVLIHVNEILEKSTSLESGSFYRLEFYVPFLKSPQETSCLISVNNGEIKITSEAGEFSRPTVFRHNLKFGCGQTIKIENGELVV